jgi:serine/threonine protein kinase
MPSKLTAFLSSTPPRTPCWLSERCLISPPESKTALSPPNPEAKELFANNPDTKELFAKNPLQALLNLSSRLPNGIEAFSLSDCMLCPSDIRLSKPLASGTFGDVSCAYLHNSRKLVAAKQQLIPRSLNRTISAAKSASKALWSFSELDSDMEILRNVLVELTMLRALGSPYCVEFLGACLERCCDGEEDVENEYWRVTMVMELCPAGSVEAVVDQQVQEWCEKGVTPSVYNSCSVLHWRLHAAASMAEALAHLHQLEIVHLDVKDANALVHTSTGSLCEAKNSAQRQDSDRCSWTEGDWSPERWSVRLCDFSFCSTAQHQHLHQQYEVGTAAYAAPEVLLDSNDSSCRVECSSDMFSYGVVLAKMLLSMDTLWVPPLRRPQDLFACDACLFEELRRLKVADAESSAGVSQNPHQDTLDSCCCSGCEVCAVVCSGDHTEPKAVVRTMAALAMECMAVDPRIRPSARQAAVRLAALELVNSN